MTFSSSLTRTWISNNSMWLKKNQSPKETPKEDPTHLLLNGGRWLVPDERRNEFHSKLAQDVVFNNSNWIVELRTPVFRLVIDLDADAQVQIDDREWLLVYKSILKTLAAAYPTLTEEDRRVVVCAAPPKHRTKDGVPVIKTGRHLIFPNIYVTNELGLRLREQMMHDVSNADVFADCPVLRTVKIEELFDESIYRKNGFRMLFSRKASGCNLCFRRRRQHERNLRDEWRASESPGTFNSGYVRFEDCEKCHGASYIDEGRPYKPSYVLSGNGVRMDELSVRFATDYEFVFRETCVRTGLTAPTSVAPLLLELTRDPTACRNPQRKRAHSSCGGGDRGTSGDWTVLSVFDDGFDMVDRFIFERFPAPHPDMSHAMRTLKRSHDGDVYIAISTSQYCLNKRSEHNSSQVYFKITRNGIDQRCFCKKKYNGTYCSRFRSALVELDPEIAEVLFPEEAVSSSQLPAEYQNVYETYVNVDNLDQSFALVLTKCQLVEDKAIQRREKSIERVKRLGADNISDELMAASSRLLHQLTIGDGGDDDSDDSDDAMQLMSLDSAAQFGVM